MNIPVKIKNKKPWILVSSYADLFIDQINFDNYEVSLENSGPENYMGRPHIDNILRILETKYPGKSENYRNTLEVFFYNIEQLVDKSLNMLYHTNPVEVEDPSKIDLLLENSINKLIIKSPDLWGDSVIKHQLIGNLSSSFVNYTKEYDINNKTSYGIASFRYLPTGDLKCVRLPLKIDSYPLKIDPVNIGNSVWGDEFLEELKEGINKEWNLNYNWKDSIYLKYLYNSIMSNKEPLSIQDFYVKSYSLSKYSNKMHSPDLEAKAEFKLLTEDFLNTYPANIIHHYVYDTYNRTTVNPGFLNGISGWSRVSDDSNITESSYKSFNENVRIEDSNNQYGNPELKLNFKHNKITQTLRIPDGKYSLSLSVRSSSTRGIKLFLGGVSVDVNIAPSETFKKITLTDVDNGGISISSSNHIETYGFEVVENEDLNSELEIEYCRLNYISS